MFVKYLLRLKKNMFQTYQYQVDVLLPWKSSIWLELEPVTFRVTPFRSRRKLSENCPDSSLDSPIIRRHSKYGYFKGCHVWLFGSLYKKKNVFQTLITVSGISVTTQLLVGLSKQNKRGRFFFAKRTTTTLKIHFLNKVNFRKRLG